MKNKILWILLYIAMSLMFVFCISIFAVPIALTLLKIDVDPEKVMICIVSGGLIFMLITVHLSTKVKVKVEIDEFILKQKSYEDFKSVVNESTARKYYRKHIDTYIAYGTRFTLYIKEKSIDEIYCFAVYYSCQFEKTIYDLSEDALNRALEQYYTLRNYGGRYVAPNLIHKTLVYCIDRDSKITDNMKIMPNYPITKYAKKHATLYAVVSFSDQKIYIPQMLKGFFGGGTASVLYKRYRKELCEILGLPKPEPKKKKGGKE